MAEEENGHLRQLIERFGTHIPLVRRADVTGSIARKPLWQVRPLGVAAVRRQVALMERDAERPYRQAAGRSTDAAARKLLGHISAEGVCTSTVPARPRKALARRRSRPRSRGGASCSR